MQQTISYAAALLERADHLCEDCLYEQALPLLERLLELEHTPLWVRREVLALLAEIELDRGRYYKARRHLTAALAYEPRDAHVLFLIGLSFEWQEEPMLDRAYQHYRQAATIDPDNPLYLAAQQCLRAELFQSDAVRRAAVRRLLTAYQADPDSPEVCYYFARGLLAAGKLGQAEWIVRRAMRRWPELAEFVELLQRIRFAHGTSPNTAPRPQLSVYHPSGSSMTPASEQEDEPVRILSFPTVEKRSGAGTAPPARTTGHSLAELLRQWPRERLESLAEALELPRHASPSAVADRLLEPEQLRRLLVRLPRAAVDCLSALCCRTVFTPEGYITSPEAPCPNVRPRRQRRCLRLLLEHGLVFAITARGKVTFRATKKTALLIPTPLWPVLQSLLQQWDAVPVPTTAATQAM